jgi:RNA polymerase sigma-70 factor (ECF subfamily)
MNDEEIVRLLFARDEAALAAVQKKYGKLCLSVAMNILADRQDAEECLNDTLLALWNLVPPEKPTQLSPYLVAIVRIRALKRLEYKTAECRNGIPTPIEELSEVLPDASLTEGSDGALLAAIEAFLHEERASARRIFIKRYFAFMSYSQIAAAERCSEAKVKSQLHRTRERLREYLRKEGFVI